MTKKELIEQWRERATHLRIGAKKTPKSVRAAELTARAITLEQCARELAALKDKNGSSGGPHEG